MLETTSVPLGGTEAAATRSGIMVYGNVILGGNGANQDLVVKAQNLRIDVLVIDDGSEGPNRERRLRRSAVADR